MRRETLVQIARRTGFSMGLLDASLDALLAPFSPDALESMAELVPSQPALGQPETVGFIMAGNVAGAGLHEIVTALISGAAVVIKSASSEPVFFQAFATTIAQSDPALGARVAVLVWDRSRADLTRALLESCDSIAAYGDDSTIAALGGTRKLIGFPSRVSGAVVALNQFDTQALQRIADKVALDVSLFEQLGCLSPHHVFLLDSNATRARHFAAQIGGALDRLAGTMPAPAQLNLEDAAAIRGIREIARWRRIGGEPVELWEGRRLDWTLVFDPDAKFAMSPGFRTVCVSLVRDPEDLRDRLVPASGRLEAFAVGADEPMRSSLRGVLRSLGVSHICPPGTMQSPPLDWRHGGGEFLELMGVYQ